ncbi:MAG: methylenetetrahydrofolate--tRNA-(uracil(54)-C(5))-methyltransferase (FADH(2)-oxidizing) TrmFO [Acidobacteria bacterium]|nr:methylenetetrahydrofolate--tRNA-(uracil(54)-C(5))-methyltransferase (FADH(2)-oxidizing) TrmFO [Acidobacteriota bacterium]MBV9477401.1 methylenetetrahydrofolate--tRNA-(uracil(54)-C(5))-methyltransferase (FADH(2)-oxidizing) TrmFO [Acidobacteriota bacterium]
MATIKIIGAGLAGSECAYALARRGHRVVLHEMRPVKSTQAHHTSNLAELVCSNSFRSSAATNAVGLLKQEMARVGSLVIRCGEDARVPAGDAFAVDRDRFSAAVTDAIANEPNISLQRGEVTTLDRGDADFLVVATGPLTSDPLFHAIDEFLGRDGLYFYDAIAPIVAADSLDFSKLYWKSRYGKGNATDYLNAAMNREEYEAFVAALLSAELFAPHDFEKAVHFEGCLPVEEIASRGIDTLRFGPMKPVGLEHPETNERPHAVVQLRKEDLSDEYFNLVGFQTKMRIPEQQRVIRMIPGLANATFARFGSMHRNTFINGPRHLRATFQTKRDERVFFAGQITGVEGYVESSAVGLLVARYIDELARTGTATPLPYHTALGALGRHVAESSPDRYQPSNVTWALIEDVVGRAKKIEKRERQAAAALSTIEKIA